MDRKYCVLLYSNYSQASIDLLAYIKELPLDFPTVTGLTMICIDNNKFKTILQTQGIEYVPTLLIEYYNKSKQKLEKDYIYMWIDQVMKALHYEWPQNPNPTDQPLKRGGKTQISALDPVTLINEETQHAPQKDVPKDTPTGMNKIDVSTVAQQMQKDRDSFLSSTDRNKTT